MRKHLRRSALSPLGALVLAACAPDLGPVSAPPTHSLGRAASVVQAPQYVVLSKKHSLPATLEAEVTAAGGRLVNAIPQIGVAVVEGGREFAGNAAGFAWAESVAPDLVVDWLGEGDLPQVEVEADASSQSHAFDPQAESFYGFQWAPQSIDAPAAWAAGITGQGARVAVLDGGIYNLHRDLVDRVDVARSRSFTTGAYNTDLGNLWHGTHVAGIVAASANGIGTIGIAPEATIIGVKVLHNGSGPFSAIINGIVYAATPIADGGAGAHVINMSLGAALDEKDPAIKAAVRELSKAVDRATTYAYQLGTTVVVSAGNTGINWDVEKTLLKLPAQNAHVISVSATGPHGWALGRSEFSRLAYYSDHGKSLLSLSAPGGNAGLIVVEGNTSSCSMRSGTTVFATACYVFDQVISTSRGTGTSTTSYAWAQGTSMAAPAVSGIVALLTQQHGAMHPSQVLARLQQGAADLGQPGKDEYYGHGWVNAWRTLR